MKLIDLHCDTLYKSVINDIPLNHKSMEVQLSNSINDNKLQCYAIWCPDDYCGDKAEELFYRAAKKLKRECLQNNIILLENLSNIKNNFFFYNNTAFFTIENGLVLNEKIENVGKFAKLGVKMITLTWNAHNPIGDGADVKKAKGITEFGKSVIKEMESFGIVVDISHASDKLFFDVAEIAEMPFVASHSNSRKIVNHRRNLTDEQFDIIKKCNGIVGLNFHNAFLSDNPKKASMYDILHHVEHFLSLGGENNICFGCDFDGCELSNDINGSTSMDKVYELFLRNNYNEALVKKIFYENALKFFENFDNRRIM